MISTTSGYTPFTILARAKLRKTFLRLVNWDCEVFLTGAADCTLKGDELSPLGDARIIAEAPGPDLNIPLELAYF